MQSSEEHIQQQDFQTITFPTDLKSILNRLSTIKPAAYAKSRNFKNGAVTYLSPYISRGVIHTKTVYEHIKEMGIAWYKVEKLVQELAWRDYWQQQWIALGERINSDLRGAQQGVENWTLPTAINIHQSNIEAIDDAIEALYDCGYMHNHMRMYVASVTCNIAHSHWLQPAKWMFYHLLDGDWASNALSWQWVAGTNANKKYYCNQQNINRYFDSQQRGTYLDCSYENLYSMTTPSELRASAPVNLDCKLPTFEMPYIDEQLPTLVYNYYNLDPTWKKNTQANRIVLIEPDFFKKYPISPRCMQFFLDVSKNIKDVQYFVGSFNALKALAASNQLHYKEHPDNHHYQGVEEPRTWLSTVEGFHRSFFSFWKKCKKELKF